MLGISIKLNCLMRDFIQSKNKNDIRLVEWVRDNYLNREWHNTIETYYQLNLKGHSIVINRNSIKLSQKIKNDTKLELFPVVERTHAGHQQLNGGSWAWTMSSRDGDNIIYGSSERIKDLLSKSNRIEFGESFAYSMCDIVSEKI